MQTKIDMYGENAKGTEIKNVLESAMAKYAEKLVKQEAAVRGDADETLSGDIIEERSERVKADAQLSNDIYNVLLRLSDIYYHERVIELSSLEDANVAGWYNEPDIELNTLFFIGNDTGNEFTEFRSHDDYYTPLSSPIPPGEDRLCMLIRKASGGAEPINGWIYVLDDESVAKSVKSLQNKIVALQTSLNGKADDIHEHIMADIADLSDKITGLETDINAETSARQTADDVLDERITAMEQSGGSGDGAFSNCFNPLETYDSENVITDINGNIYVGQSMELGSAYANYTVDVTEFARAISKGNVMLKLGFAHLHMALDECDMGGFAPYESGLTITYADGATERVTFGEGNDNISIEHTNSSKDISFTSGYSGNYNYALYTFKFENTKDIEGIKFSLIFDNYYTETPSDGGACIQNVYVDTLACYDEECVITREQLDEILSEQGGTSITVDSELSSTSENPVQNKVINEALNNIKNSQITVSSTMNTSTTDPVEGGVIQTAIDTLGMRLESRIEELEQNNTSYTHTTTPTQIGTWIDGQEIYRIDFSVGFSIESIHFLNGFIYLYDDIIPSSIWQKMGQITDCNVLLQYCWYDDTEVSTDSILGLIKPSMQGNKIVIDTEAAASGSYTWIMVTGYVEYTKSLTTDGFTILD